MSETRNLVYEHGRRAYLVVDLFEQELADFTGAPFAVAVNACTNALLLALTWERMHGLEGPIRLPRCTYIGVRQSVVNAGFEVDWDDGLRDWQDNGDYPLLPSRVWDSARRLDNRFDMSGYVCLSMHVAKQLPIGRGGAILTDDEEAAEWFRAARMDGRPPGKLEPILGVSYHCPMPPDVAARGLDILSRWNDAGWSPPPLPPTDYPDLSLIYPREGVTV